MVNEERTKRYSWGVEATTSLFLEGGLLAACNVLYGYHLSEVFTVGLGFGLNTPVGDLLPGTDFFARLEAELPAGKVAPYLSFDIGGMYSPWSGMPFFAFVNPGMGLSFRLRNADRIYLGLRYQYMWRYLYPYRLYSHNLTFKFGYRF
ncbi:MULTISPECIES: hypothetical protein [Rikenellaceae]|uniref:Uncharacterized protein n=1 Tax=Alistipes inops TaxID=1501391 RepID=A0ABR4YHK4_9BACT|nr:MULTISPECIES: hypothetical protein [Rikenellaceae]KHE41584.1 hypothetical protein LG35_08370 [Alistipes inops]